MPPKVHERAIGLKPGTTIAAGGRLTIYAQTRREDGFTFGISCGNDAVYLFQADGTLLDDVLVGDYSAASTWGRLPDGLDGLFAANAPTLPPKPHARMATLPI
jgi:hypothetical protein